MSSAVWHKMPVELLGAFLTAEPNVVALLRTHLNGLDLKMAVTHVTLGQINHHPLA